MIMKPKTWEGNKPLQFIRTTDRWILIKYTFSLTNNGVVPQKLNVNWKHHTSKMFLLPFVFTYFCNSSTWDMKARQLWAHGQPGLFIKFQAIVRRSCWGGGALLLFNCSMNEHYSSNWSTLYILRTQSNLHLSTWKYYYCILISLRRDENSKYSF